MITTDQLKLIMPLHPKTVVNFVPMLNPAMEQYGITTVLREAAYLATIAHESHEFDWLQEIWGPTPEQVQYDPPSDVARTLGNTNKGDGYRYRGRGPIQITGRTNYAQVSVALGFDFIFNPDALASPGWGITASCWWWKTNGCNALADVGDFRAVTKRVNGGYNGMADRQMYYDRAMLVLKQPQPDFSNVRSGSESTA